MCDIIILTSWSEGVSNTILESYACGKVLISSIHSIPKEIPNWGYTYNLKHKMFVECIKRLYKDKSELEIKGKAARDWVVNNCSWDIYGKKMLNIFKGVTKNV